MPGSSGAGSPEGLEGLLGGLVVIGRGLRVLRVVWGGGPVRRGQGPPPGRLLPFCSACCSVSFEGSCGLSGLSGGGGIAFLAASGGVLLGPLKDFNDCLWQESICSPLAGEAGKGPQPAPRRPRRGPATEASAVAWREAVGEQGGEEEADLLQSWLARASLRESGGSTQREVIWV